MTSDQELRLLRIAEGMGIRVEDDVGGRLAPGHLGGWVPRKRLILLRPGLGPRNRLHTLAHEMGHAVHDDPAGHHPRHEARAERWAANFLVDPREYAELERMYDGHLGAIASEMGVTVSILATWRDNLEMRSA